MTISKEMVEAINDQFNFEVHSAHLYASMAAHLFHQGLPGFGMWLTKQYKEEMSHAERFHRYLDDREERVFYQALPAPKAEWSSVLEVFEDALAHEQKVSERISKLMILARDQRDFATELALQWFITEQVEEESSVQRVIDKIKMAGGSESGIYLLDKEMAQRQ